MMRKRRRIRFKINNDTMTTIVVLSLSFCVGVVVVGIILACFCVDISSIVSSALLLFGTELGICGLMKLYDKGVEQAERRAEERRKTASGRKGARMMFLMENWYLVVALMAVAGMVGVCIGRFLKMPTSEQRERVKEWLLWAVTQAEAELGSGTGKLKLRQTYDLFIQRFPALAMAVSFDTFSLWVDEALEEMRKLLKENKTVRELVKG